MQPDLVNGNYFWSLHATKCLVLLPVGINMNPINQSDMSQLMQMMLEAPRLKMKACNASYKPKPARVLVHVLDMPENIA